MPEPIIFSPFHFFIFSPLLRLLADVGQDSTIHIEHVTIHGVRGMRGEEHSGTSQLRRIEPTASRCLGTDEAIEWMAAAVRLAFTQRSSLGRSNVARAYAVTLDVVLTILRADVTGEHLQAALGSSVCRNGLTTQLRHHRADVDDLTLTALHHLRDDGRRADERTHKVDVDDLLELSALHLVHGDALDDTSVVDEDVNLTNLLMDGLHKGLYCIFVGHVADIALHIADASFLVVVKATLQGCLLPMKIDLP